MTGSDISWWIALGVVLVISGLLLLRSGRRRRRTD
jgi:LPXTG-motif cell wall-anchored protein